MTSAAIDNEKAYQYYLSVKENFNSVCKPLLQHFGLRFAYLKFFDKYQYFFINSYNNDQFTRLRLTQIHDDGKVFEQQKRTTADESTQHYFWPSVVPKQDRLLSALYHENIWNGYSIIKKHQLETEIFTFVTTKDQESINNFYKNNSGILEHFITYFKDKANDLINVSDESIVARLKKVDDEGLPLENYSEKLGKFLTDTKIDRIAVNTNSGPCFLSNAEAKCLVQQCQEHILNNMSQESEYDSKEVDFHLENIKKKTGYSSEKDFAKLLKDVVNHNVIMRNSVV
ncbi:MAG: hypothetical protein ABFQ95_02965 [Pseudomonadota bacterium]